MALLTLDHDPMYDAGVVRLAFELLKMVPPTKFGTPRQKNVLRQRLAICLGIAAADWDLQAPPDREGEVTRFPFSAWLDDLRSPFNVGSIVRTAEAYGFEAVFSSLDTPGIDHPRARRTAMGAEAHLVVEAWSLEQLRDLWSHKPVFALELGGIPVDRFEFPDHGLMLVGGEEVGLSPEALSWADASAGRVSLPLYGRKASLNVGVAFGVVAAAWTQRFFRDEKP